MNIKNIFLGFISLLLTGSIISCNSFLDENPKENMSLGQFYKTAAHARSGVNNLYSAGFMNFYNANVYAGATIGWGSYLSGLFDNEYKGQEVIVQYSQELTISEANISGQMNSLWRDCYSAIGRANTALKYIPTIDDPVGFSAGEQESLLAQAKFFRALNYFHLVKVYGDVPLILDPYESLDGIYMKRTPTAEVYTQIIKDLKEASEVLKSEAFTKNGMRVSKTTAETLLADVYMQMSGYPLQENHYKDAATAARNVINSGKHSLTKNVDEDQQSAYNILRMEDNLTEYIFSKERTTSTSGFTSNWTQLSFPVYAAAWGIFKYTLTNNAFSPMPTIVNAYNPDKDLRIKERQFFFNSYEYKTDSISKFKAPAPWLYMDEEAMFETGLSGKDFPIYRYSEVLLTAAEAIAQSEGVTSEAVGYLADVRSRAYTKQTKEEIAAELTALSKDDFIKEVWAERLRELCLDHKIWDDVQRTRMYPVTSSDNKGVVSFVNVIGAKNPFGATFQEKHLLWPISDQELQRNPELNQNPGYETKD